MKNIYITVEISMTVWKGGYLEEIDCCPVDAISLKNLIN